MVSSLSSEVRSCKARLLQPSYSASGSGRVGGVGEGVGEVGGGGSGRWSG